MAQQQDRVELKGSARAAFPGGQDAGPADPSQRMDVSVLLRRGSAPAEFAALADMGARLPRDRKYMTREEFGRVHGASAADVEKIRAFASQYDLKIVSEDRATRIVKLDGTVQAFNAAFGVTLRRYEHSSGAYRCRTGNLTIPSNLDGIIEGVFGLDNRPQAKTHFRLRKKNLNAQARATDVSYSPLQVAKAYAFPTGATGAGQTIAVIELGGGYTRPTSTAFFAILEFPLRKSQPFPLTAARILLRAIPAGPMAKWNSISKWPAQSRRPAQIAAYFAPNTDQGFIDAITTAVHDAKLKPSIISISWGGPESSWTEQSRNALNSACQDGAMMGVTVLAASGDNGSSDGSTDGAATVDFPSASPYVVGCGGTKLTISSGGIGSEQTWNELSANEGATGGGVSEFFALPAYQQNAKVPKAPNGFVGRGVPDVAGDADPASGYNVIVDGQQSVIGGTSAVAPLWAGLFALINESLGANAGYINTLLYSSKVEATFHDVTSGSNGDYSAGPGWDACTGLGSPNGAALLAALRGN